MRQKEEIACIGIQVRPYLNITLEFHISDECKRLGLNAKHFAQMKRTLSKTKHHR